MPYFFNRRPRGFHYTPRFSNERRDILDSLLFYCVCLEDTHKFGAKAQKKENHINNNVPI